MNVAAFMDEALLTPLHLRESINIAAWTLSECLSTSAMVSLRLVNVIRASTSDFRTSTCSWYLWQANVNNRQTGSFGGDPWWILPRTSRHHKSFIRIVSADPILSCIALTIDAS
eukprot:863572_1